MWGEETDPFLQKYNLPAFPVFELYQSTLLYNPETPVCPFV